MLNHDTAQILIAIYLGLLAGLAALLVVCWIAGRKEKNERDSDG